MILKVIVCVALYLLVGAAICGIVDIKMEENGFFGLFFAWPVVIITGFYMVISEMVRRAIHKK